MMEINREIKEFLVEMMYTGVCTDEQRLKIAELFGLYDVQRKIVVENESQKEIMEMFMKKK